MRSIFDAAKRTLPIISATCRPALKEFLQVMRLEEKVDKPPHAPRHSSIHKRLPTVSTRLPLHTAMVTLSSHPECGCNTGIAERLRRNPACAVQPIAGTSPAPAATTVPLPSRFSCFHGDCE